MPFRKGKDRFESIRWNGTQILGVVFFATHCSALISSMEIVFLKQLFLIQGSFLPRKRSRVHRLWSPIRVLKTISNTNLNRRVV